MQETRQSQLEADLQTLLSHLGPLPRPMARPVLVIVAGLPGSGKSYLARRLAQAFPLAVVESDHMREVLFGTPRHTQEENLRLFSALHALVQHLLSRGVPVLFDATNLQESHREPLYRIADRTGAGLVIVWVHAPEEVILERLRRRMESPPEGEHSSAGPEVYQRMKQSVEPIRRNHLVVDTSRDLEAGLRKVLREVRKATRIM